MEHNWSGTDAIGGDESEKEEAKTDSELNEETKEGLGNVKLIRSIDKIEKQIIKGSFLYIERSLYIARRDRFTVKLRKGFWSINV